MRDMSWLYERRVYPSERNGEITVTRRLGQWSVAVGGYNQSSPDVNAIWRDAFRRVKGTVVEKPRVLMLGLGAGGTVKELHRIFPYCRITAVEYDAVMIKLADGLKLYEPYPAPSVLEGDASTVIPALTSLFDLIVIDLSLGNKPPSFLKDPTFLTILSNRLSPAGIVLMNVCASTEYLDAAQRAFPHVRRWRYKYNMLGSFGNSV